jgi:sugar/nucleoside kinase (ribokinase family)
MEVEPLPLAAISDPLRGVLSETDLLIASRHDLAAEANDPVAQLAALRNAFGSRPVMVVTNGAAGLWLSTAGGAIDHLVPPRVVTGRSMIGAGDMLAALMLAAMVINDPAPSASEAMALVGDILDARPPLEEASEL